MPLRTPPLFSLGLPFRVLWTVLLGAAIYLAGQAIVHPPEADYVLPRADAPVEWKGTFHERVDEVTAALEKLALPFRLPAAIKEQQGGGALLWIHRRYEVMIPQPADAEALDRAFDPLRDAFPSAVVQEKQTPDGPQIAVGVDGLRTHTVQFHWLQHQPHVAIVIDDLGNDLLVIRQLLEIPAPLTCAVMPFRPFSRSVAERLTIGDREVLLHLPMEAQSGAEFGAGRVLRTSASEDEISGIVDAALDELPQAIGVNNHMGSKFTADAKRMRLLLDRVKRARMFFLDSVTTGDSVACEVAEKMRVPCLRRAIFLDHEDDEGAIRAQLQKLANIARADGVAIGIAHPRSKTLEVLRTDLPAFAAAGVDIVPISRLVEAQSLSRH